MNQKSVSKFTGNVVYTIVVVQLKKLVKIDHFQAKNGQFRGKTGS